MPAPKPRDSDEQRAVLAARHRAAGVDVVVDDRREARRGIELHDVARVVVREQQLAVVAGDRAVGVVAFPRPDDLPALTRGDDAGDGGGRRRRGRVGGGARRWTTSPSPPMRNARRLVAHFASTAASPGFCQACCPLPRSNAEDGLCAQAAPAVQPTNTARASVDFMVVPQMFFRRIIAVTGAICDGSARLAPLPW